VRSTWPTAGLVAWSLLLLSCSSEPSKDVLGSDPVPSDQVPAETQVPSILPSTSGLSAPDQAANSYFLYVRHAVDPAILATLWEVEQRLTQTCLNSSGFEYEMIPSPDYIAQATRTREALRPLSGPEASQFGYNVPISLSLDDSRHDSAVSAMTNRINAEPSFATAHERCSSETELRMLNGPGDPSLIEQLIALVDSGDGQVKSTIENDDTYISLNSSWAECMSGLGFSEYLSPFLVRFDPLFSGDVVSEAEIQAATAEVTCSDSVDYFNRYRKIYDLYAEVWESENAASLLELESKIRSAADYWVGMLENE
jgi:hypothetical protein